MKKRLLTLFVTLYAFASVYSQCNPGQDTLAPVFEDQGDGSQARPFKNISTELIGTYPSGTYYFDVEGVAFQGEVDNDTDGGGWLMVLNYLHIAGDRPDLTVRNTDLPLLNSSTLGDNEAGTQYWGHVGNELAAKLDFEELRFYAITNDHDRVIHFTTKLANGLTYAKTGTGNFLGLNNPENFTKLVDHTANLPEQGGRVFTDQGDNALTTFPFWSFGRFHWGIGGGRWEVDNNGQNRFNTLHRVWVRGDASPDVFAFATAELDSNGQVTIDASLYNIEVSDNCVTPVVTLSQTSFDCSHLGSNTLQLTAADAKNNSTSLNVTLTVEDNLSPIIDISNLLTDPIFFRCYYWGSNAYSSGVKYYSIGQLCSKFISVCFANI